MSHPVLDTKDRRSFEHARQEHLHPSDRHRTRSPRSHKRVVGNSCKDYMRNARFQSTKWLDPLTVDDLDVAADIAPVEYDPADYETSAPASHVLPLELSLNDLIRPARKRKGMWLLTPSDILVLNTRRHGRHSGIAQDYEFIPRVRTVMIIEDGASDSASGSSGDDYDDAHDEWEVIPASTGKRRERHPAPRATYAAVAGATK